MIILTIRTDKPIAEIGLFQNSHKLKYITWKAHRELSNTINVKINDILRSTNKTLGDIDAVLVYGGPGSFTGLRIGVSVANALAYSLDLLIAETSGEDWIKEGMEKINKHPKEKQVFPDYGQDVYITKPKK
jgi:tRNA threonylcarbamoyladenosine biosynthesis protein TsaB